MKKILMIGLLVSSLMVVQQTGCVEHEMRYVLKFGAFRFGVPIAIMLKNNKDPVSAAAVAVAANGLWVGAKELLVDAGVLDKEGPKEGWKKVFASLVDDSGPIVLATLAGFVLPRQQAQEG